MSPQRITLKLRPNVESTFNFSAIQSDNPVDIYFVMDLSRSMYKSQQNLVDASEKIAEKISNLTRDFNLGFGSFSDKKRPPFAMTAENYRKLNRKLPYSFRNNLKLGKNAEIFKERVKNSDLTRNVDSSESGFDAVMQAILCTDEIGWEG